jgi:hypothetical protein
MGPFCRNIRIGHLIKRPFVKAMFICKRLPRVIPLAAPAAGMAGQVSARTPCPLGSTWAATPPESKLIFTIPSAVADAERNRTRCVIGTSRCGCDRDQNEGRRYLH